jgi:hypothetical protein
MTTTNKLNELLILCGINNIVFTYQKEEGGNYIDFNEPEKRYDESRLDYEVFDSLNLTKIFSKYLNKSDIRDSKLEDLGI